MRILKWCNRCRLRTYHRQRYPPRCPRPSFLIRPVAWLIDLILDPAHCLRCVALGKTDDSMSSGSSSPAPAGKVN